ncbi:MAG: helix-turn-helix domain-containing protein [Muribaculaceae bacterium]|nr:helix-turn-helix domain-containing protein [Muribaculaceae bacterium]
MNYNIGEYIGNLILNAGITQAKLARDINVPRQLLSCVISGKREMSLQLAIKLESYFSLPDGELLKMQTMQAIKKHKQSIRNHICEQLTAKNAFWSYNVKSFDTIPDEELIEKCFTTLDIDDINLMFELYPRKQIQQVWRKRMAIQGEYMQRLNILIAMYYFDIKEPEKYLAKVEKQHINNLLKIASNASGINY